MKISKLFILIAAICSFAALSGSATAAGRKYGLFVGINKYSGANELRGCVNDVTNVRATLMQKFGFLAPDTTLLTDASATRENILSNLMKYQAVAQKGDIFVFDYSGHGTLFPDARSEDQDETTLTYLEVVNPDTGKTEVWYPRAKYDSAIVPVDAGSATSGKPWRNLILDDELAAIFAGFTKKGAQVVFISDSCHSGTIGKGKKTKDPIRTASLASLFGARRYEELELGTPAVTRTSGFPIPVNPLYIVLTGSKDDEFSLDAGNLPQPMGLFTYYLLKQINSPGGTRLTYETLMAAVSKNVAVDAFTQENNQHPQIDGRYGNAKTPIFSLPK
ncbi:MAG: caspase domain-containing protein [Pyrinomonadaceae bacterium]